MKNITAEIKGLYEVEKISLEEIAACVRDHIEKHNCDIRWIYMQPPQASELANLINSVFIFFPLYPGSELKLQIKRDDNKQRNTIFIL